MGTTAIVYGEDNRGLLNANFNFSNHRVIYMVVKPQFGWYIEGTEWNSRRISCMNIIYIKQLL